ncbi:MAG: PHP-associated domain-containing protein [Planctomycetota bacterium]|jgi:PHP family Zn ribbon phosphoesterase
MEVTSSEEVHILGLFDSEADLMDLQDTVYQNLPGENSEEAFGPQLVADEWGNVVEKNHRLLIGATTLTVDQVVDAIHRRSGLAIASHVDRERFSLIGQLGFVPEGLELDALEVSDPSRTGEEYGYPVITSSDAHFPEDVGKSLTSFEMEDASLSEIGKALRHELGRRIVAN